MRAQLLVVIFIVTIVVGVSIPAIQKVRDTQARTQSIQNLKTIALGFHEYHDKNKYLPYNGTTQPYAKGGGIAKAGDAKSGSWAFQILPYVDQKAMFANRDASVGVAVFMCPGRGRPMMCSGTGGPGAWTDYFLNSYLNNPNGAWGTPNIQRTLGGITDGSSNTILVGHGQIRPQDYGTSQVLAGFTEVIFKGGSPAMCRPNKTVAFGRDAADSGPGNWGGPFSQGALMAMGDATVRMFPYTMHCGTIRDGVGVFDARRENDPPPRVVRPPLSWFLTAPERVSGPLSWFLTPSGNETVILSDI